jgi:integrase
MMNRRSKGEGSIRQRPDGRWEARAVVGGRRRSWFGATYDEVEAKLQEGRRSARRGSPIIMPGLLTVRQYLDVWHDSRLYSTESTQAQYGGIIRNHINPEIGSVRLTMLSPEHIRRLLRERAKNGAGDRLLKYIKQVLHVALQDAVEERKLEWNPADAVKVREPLPKERGLLDWEQQAQLLAAVEEDRLFAAYVLMLSCALRPGECFGLTWEDVDWERGLLSVRRVLVKAEKGWKLRSRTKTNKAAVLPLAAPVLEALREHRIRQMAEQRENEELWFNPAGLVFVTPIGGYVDPDTFRKQFLRVAPGLTPYSLRHSAATFALADGDDYKTVQALLRHSRASVTMNVYTHVVDRVQRESATRRAERLFGKRGQDEGSEVAAKAEIGLD